MLSRGVRVVVCLLSIGLAGCGPEHGRDTAPVSGVITLDGKPLANAKVTFQPKGGGPSSAGFTNASGEYTLTGFKGDPGAVVAEHRVLIYSAGTVGNTDTDSDDGPRPVELIPNRYNAQSVLTIVVQDGQDNVANFDLTSK